MKDLTDPVLGGVTAELSQEPLVAAVSAPDLAPTDIAIIGMAAHLPGAGDIGAYWANLVAGVESIREITREALIAAGENAQRLAQRNYVPFAAPLDAFDHFDPAFFGFSQKEAAILDPQHRQFLEVAWQALENAGHSPAKFHGAIGVYAGCGMGSYLWRNLCSHQDLVDQTGMFLLRHTGNDKDFLATRVSHILNLTGPSVNVQTACSTSLVAVHMASQALLNGECDMALAGGVTIELPQSRGYLFQPGEILSPDGHCHAFDHRAGGTVFGSGAGCVVLRRAEDARRAGDHIWAIIKGSAVNNDGGDKAGYLAPSVSGQAACIAEAQAMAGISADQISYVECHGTGTPIGDPIEVAALTAAFRETTEKRGYCRIGSVKTNIGHLDTAAGVAGLIKVALSLYHRLLPPSLGYQAANPAIDFAGSPFLVNDRLTPWDGHALFAGVNSLGVGGTNAHVVLGAAPPPPPRAEASDWPCHPLVISARSKPALEAQSQSLSQYLRALPQDHPDHRLADIAFTLKEGRTAFEKRRVLVAHSATEAADLLAQNDPRRVFTHEALDRPELVFMFPGGGAQYAGMARDLYQTQPVFAEFMDQGLAVLEGLTADNIRALWLAPKDEEPAANLALRMPSRQLPLIMITEYALAQLYAAWGVTPNLLLGHSMGENTAAAVAGVISFEDCIRLVHLRGQLFDRVSGGGMLSVPLSEAGLAPFMTPDLDIASVNAPELTVVSGPGPSLDLLAQGLKLAGIDSQRIAIDVAAHSRMLEPLLQEFGKFLRSISLSAPQIPIVSNVTGQLLTPDQAQSPDYWVSHLRKKVDFQSCMQLLRCSDEPPRLFMEMGPGRALSSLAQANGVAGNRVIPALRHPDHDIADDNWYMGTIARLWACGLEADWSQIWGQAPCKRLPLPGYAFQRARYFIEPSVPALNSAPPDQALQRLDDIADWAWVPHWAPKAAGFDIDDLGLVAPQTWLIFTDEAELCTALTQALRDLGHRVVMVRAGDVFAQRGGDYTLAPERGREGYDLLLADLSAKGLKPDRIIHGWLLTQKESFRPGSSTLHRNLEQGYWSLLFMLQALGDQGLQHETRLLALTNGAVKTRNEPLLWPEKAMISGPLKVGGQEMPQLILSALDIDLPVHAAQTRKDLQEAILEEALSDHACEAALRAGRRYEAGLRRMTMPSQPLNLAPQTHVMITGGFGGIGLTLAEDLIRRHRARITLVARSPLPNRKDWAQHLSDHSDKEPISRRIRALMQLEGLGAELHIAVADVANAQEMADARRTAEAHLGPIRMVIHAAGHIADGPLQLKTPDEIEDVFAPKVHGTQVLDQVFKGSALEVMVLFSSTSTLIAPVGQVDYVAANAYLNAFAKAKSVSQTGATPRVIALNWGIWQGVGMAADSLAEQDTAPLSPRAHIDFPMLSEAGFDAAGARIFWGRLSADDWIIKGHRLVGGPADGQALMPGTGYLELAAEAWSAHMGGARGAEDAPAFQLQDLNFMRPLALGEDAHRAIRVKLTPALQGYQFVLQSQHRVQGQSGWLTHASARILPLTAPAPRLDIAAVEQMLEQAETGQGVVSPQEAHLDFGPRWRVLKSRALGGGQGIAHLELPEPYGTDIDQGWRIHPALMDLATGWAIELCAEYSSEHLWVPVSYGSVQVFGALPAKVVSHMRQSDQTRAQGRARFDITLARPDGQVLIEIRDFMMQRLEAGLPLPSPSVRLLEADALGLKPLSAAQERLRATFAQGIRPKEGAVAFGRALAAPGAQICLSSLDLPGLIAQTRQGQSLEKTQPHHFARPELEADYLAPRSETETRLALYWQELLGLQKVGVEDSFFDLGGHSLIAVRLFSMIRKSFGLDLPISVLLNAPTIAACAAVIDQALAEGAVVGGAADGGADNPPAADSTSPGAARPLPMRPQFKHLVPMHRSQAASSTRPALFVVAGMFGNVLNLRHLAHCMGRERRFYGLQAKGLFGEDPPHRDFSEAARDYIQELRHVQPFGPYLLGGFSGGGLIAWEMARQLEEAGEVVALLVLLDTPLPMRPRLTALDRALIKLSELRGNGLGYLRAWYLARRAWRRRLDPVPSEVNTFHNGEIEAAFRHALTQYQMQPRLGPTLLLRPALDFHWKVWGGKWVSRAKEYVFSDNDFGRFSPGLQVIETPGDHDSMVLEPNVRVLAAELKRCITATEDPAKAPGLMAAAQ